MSVYIKGMEMPVDCLACRVACDKESYMVIGRPPKCPLVEAPDGDLIGRAETIEAVELMEIFLGERKKNAVIRGIQALPSAEAKPTVIRSRSLMPTKDFMEWAKRIREVNPNAVVIPCDAEVASAEAVQGEWIETSEGTMCGNCHKFPYDDGEYHIANWHSDFCPNCGAIMKGGDTE